MQHVGRLNQLAAQFANLVIAMLLVLCAGVLMYAVLVIRETSLTWIGYGFFYGLPLGVCVGLALLFNVRNEYKINLVMGVCSLFFGVYAIEGVLTWRSSPRASGKGDFRPAFEVLKELRNQGEDAVPNTFPAWFLGSETFGRGEKRLLPLSGVAHASVVLCNEVGQWITYQSDEQGFHNPPGLYAGRLDLVGVGDSYTQGVCVASEKNIFGVLRQEYHQTLNLGMAGNGPLLELASLREYAKPFAPKVVVWLYYEGNDLEDLETEKQNPGLMQYLERNYSQALLRQTAALQTALRQATEELITSKFQQEARTPAWQNYLRCVRMHPVFRFLIAERIFERLGMLPSVKRHFGGTPDLPLFRRILALAKQEIEAWGGALLFVYLTEKSRFVRFSGTPSPYREQILTIVNDLGIPVVDTYRLFQAQSNPLALHQGHYTEKGYELVAQAILKTIRESLRRPSSERPRP